MSFTEKMILKLFRTIWHRKLILHCLPSSLKKRLSDFLQNIKIASVCLPLGILYTQGTTVHLQHKHSFPQSLHQFCIGNINHLSDLILHQSGIGFVL